MTPEDKFDYDQEQEDLRRLATPELVKQDLKDRKVRRRALIWEKRMEFLNKHLGPILLFFSWVVFLIYRVAVEHLETVRLGG